jgi:hypothetical protein
MRAELNERTALYRQGGKFVQSVPQPAFKLPAIETSPVRTASATEPVQR